MQDINMLSELLGIIWEILKDQPFQTMTLYIGFIWDLEWLLVYLSPPKADKYLIVIHNWRKRLMHTLQDIQQLYGKLLHACAAATQGKAYLISLEEMLSFCSTKPFTPHRPGKHMTEDLEWWSLLLQSGGISKPIYPTAPLTNLLAFSDASSGIGLGIIIGEFWRAWHLVPGWQTANGKQDIRWAEAVAFELLIYSLTTITNASSNFLIHRDNTGIIKGWWKCRHYNQAVNDMF